ncbi:MAG TPA: hypothetical protein VFB13_04085 [Reyranella sp.]|jgi:tetratricopeptide (TPR) repeat protein|nr:hypothetical protein [Reyranella sp.]
MKTGAILALVLLLGTAGDAAAQRVVGCFYQGRQVADSMCASGGGGGGYYGGGGSALGYAIGGAIRQMIESFFAPDTSAQEARAASVRLNNEGVALSNQGNRRAAIAKYREAVAIDHDNAIAAANYFMERAQLDCDLGRLADALREARQAVEASNRNAEGRTVTLAAAQESVRFLERMVSNQNAEQRETFDSKQRELVGQMRTLNGPGTGDLQVDAQRGAFGSTELKPRDLASAPPPPPVQTKSALEQASSAQRSGEQARGAAGTEEAKRLGDCTFASGPCAKPTVTGTATVNIHPITSPATDKIVARIPDTLRDKPEIKGLVDQYRDFDLKMQAKQLEADQLKSQIAKASGPDAKTLEAQRQSLQNEVNFYKQDLASTKDQIKKELNHYNVPFDEK